LESRKAEQPCGVAAEHGIEGSALNTGTGDETG